MKKSIYLAVIALAFISVISSCKKDDTETPSLPNPVNNDTTGTLNMYFDNMAGEDQLNFGQGYVNENGDSLSFTLLNYYISNIVLIKEDGSEYTVPKNNSYFLVKHGIDSTQNITLPNIPIGKYKGFRFVLGVDSLKSTAPINERTGVLDPAGAGAGMYWSWNSGYIFFKAEGVSPQAPLDTPSNSKKFRYHIGLFGGYNAPTLNNLKTITVLALNGQLANVTKTITPEMHIEVDILEMFKNPTKVSIAANPTVMVSPYSAIIANNYADMFMLHHIHN